MLVYVVHKTRRSLAKTRKEMYKSVMYVQSCCFPYKTYSRFSRGSRCCLRRWMLKSQ